MMCMLILLKRRVRSNKRRLFDSPSPLFTSPPVTLPLKQPPPKCTFIFNVQNAIDIIISCTDYLIAHLIAPKNKALLRRVCVYPAILHSAHKCPSPSSSFISHLTVVASSSLRHRSLAPTTRTITLIEATRTFDMLAFRRCVKRCVVVLMQTCICSLRLAPLVPLPRLPNLSEIMIMTYCGRCQRK